MNLLLSGDYLKITWVADLILDMSLHKTSRLQILNSLSKRGHETTLIGVRSKQIIEKNSVGPRLFLLPLRYVPFIEPILYAASLGLLLPFYILQFKPDFVIFEPELSVVASIPSLIMSKLTKTRFILDIRSTPVESNDFNGFFRRFMFGVSVVLAKTLFSGITIITPMMRKEVSKKYGVVLNKMGVWTTGVDLKLFNPGKHISEGVELRRKLGLSNSFVVFYHGHLSPGRGLVEAVEAFKILKKTQLGMVLFLIGSGSSTEILKSLVRRADLQGQVIIHGPVEYERVPDFISIADVCIVPLPDHPDWRSQCSLKLLEYFSMEKVVIATDIPAHTVVAGDSPCCLYVSSSEPEVLAEMMLLARSKRDKLGSWGKSGRVIVRRNYTWHKVALDLENYLYSL